jgi:DNA polymerase III subunit gamma/tau
MLSKSAFNALLKIIEEPPEYLVFILATTDPQKILDTVKSRCQMFGFKNISMDGIINRLKYVCNLESIKYDEA